jgi:hypothetical protein
MSDTSNCPIDLEAASEQVRRHAGPKTPPALRMMAARGLAPMAPRDLVTAQFVLTFDADPKVAETAEASLQKLDARLANAVLSDAAVSPHVLGHLARALATHDAYVEKLLLNPSTPTEVFADVASVCSEPVAELVANNQARLLEAPDIVRGLAQNPHVLKSTRDRVVDFLVRNGIVLEGLHDFEDALLRLGADDRIEAASHVDIPPELLDERFLSEEEREALAKDRKLIDEDEEGTDERDELDKLPLEEKLRRLPVPSLVAYATKGNRQVRKALIRHTNRLVALAAVTSPMIQEPEIIEAVNSKVTHQDAIAHIAKDKKSNWVRNYQVKLGLVSNPKTPLPSAMKLVPLLNARDIKLLAKSKNVPMGIRNQATKLSRRGV